MGLNLVGNDPNAIREYVWIADDAVDHEASDLKVWGETGRGLVIKDGQKPTVFKTKALTPTVLELVLNCARVTPGPVSAEPLSSSEIIRRNWPAVERMAVAYGLFEVDNGPAIKRVHDAGGWRVDDATLDILDRQRFEGLRLLQHLGNLILGDSRPTDLEAKP